MGFLGRAGAALKPHARSSDGDAAAMTYRISMGRRNFVDPRVYFAVQRDENLGLRQPWFVETPQAVYAVLKPFGSRCGRSGGSPSWDGNDS